MGLKNSQSSDQARSNVIFTHHNHFLINGKGQKSQRIVNEVNKTVKMMIYFLSIDKMLELSSLKAFHKSP